MVKKRKRKINSLPLALFITICLAIIAFVYGGKSNTAGISLDNEEFKIEIPTGAPAPTDLPTPTPDPDPFITCISTVEQCKGQSIQTRQSECKNITCCQIEENWKLYTSLAECRQDQAGIAPTSTIKQKSTTTSSSYNCEVSMDRYNLCMDQYKREMETYTNCIEDYNQDLEKYYEQLKDGYRYATKPIKPIFCTMKPYMTCIKPICY